MEDEKLWVVKESEDVRNYKVEIDLDEFCCDLPHENGPGTDYVWFVDSAIDTLAILIGATPSRKSHTTLKNDYFRARQVFTSKGDGVKGTFTYEEGYELLCSKRLRSHTDEAPIVYVGDPVIAFESPINDRAKADRARHRLEVLLEGFYFSDAEPKDEKTFIRFGYIFGRFPTKERPDLSDIIRKIDSIIEEKLDAEEE